MVDGFDYGHGITAGKEQAGAPTSKIGTNSFVESPSQPKVSESLAIAGAEFATISA